MSATAQVLYDDPLDGVVLHSSDLDDHVNTLLTHRHYLSQAQVDRIARALRIDVEESAPRQAAGMEYGADFDMAYEVQQQITAVRAIRDHVMDSRGRLREGITARDAKEVVTSGSTLLSSLMKFHSSVVNMERLRLLERAVVEVLREEDDDLRDRVLTRLAQRLEQ